MSIKGVAWMKSIVLKNVSKSYNGQPVLEDFNLTIPSGKFFALLGPSGCGKTTLLRLIAGFETVDAGQIFLGDTEITHMPIYRRKVNTVFQNYALFPHLNVFDNVAFSLRIKKVAPDVIEEKVIKMLKMVHLDKHIYKAIDQLSGGQQQRVALARSIINEPEVLLLDEPLAALDVKLREHMLVELIDLQDQLKTTFVYVTHDQQEALTVADQMAIMNYDGIAEQIDTPREVYEYPASTFVARFVGKTNIIEGVARVEQDSSHVDTKTVGSFVVDSSERTVALHDGAPIYMSIRPEKIAISKRELDGFEHHLQGTVQSIVYQGFATIYYIKIEGGMRIAVFRQNSEHVDEDVIDYDDHVHLYWRAHSVVLLNA